MKLKTGEVLHVRTFDRGVVERRLVRISGDIAEVTTPEEWETAEKEGRNPVCIGFPVTDITPAGSPSRQVNAVVD